MIARLLSLFALLALALMPFGMAAPAAAAVEQPAMAMSGAGHCAGESAPETGKSLPGSHCGAACSMLLPAAAAVERSPPLVAATVRQDAVTVPAKHTPELNTPPPKAA